MATCLVVQVERPSSAIGIEPKCHLQDPACGSYSNALLFYKGYQAIQVHRIAHHLWNLDQKISARNLQSRVSEVGQHPKQWPTHTAVALTVHVQKLECNHHGKMQTNCIEDSAILTTNVPAVEGV